VSDTALSKPTERSLQFIKGGSCTITVPRWWVSKHHLAKGSRLFLAEDGASLRIVPKALMSEKRIARIDLDALEDTKSVKYRVWTYYMQGADRIEVRSRAPIPADVKRAFREIRMDLPGIEVVKEDSESILFGVSVGDERRPLDDLIREIQSVALSVHRDSMHAVMKGDRALASEVLTRETEILRSYRALIRKLALCSMNPELAYLSGVGSSRELITYALLARDLNRTVYHALYIARHVVRFGGDMEEAARKRLKAMSNTASLMQRLAVDAFLERDFSKAQRVMKLMTEVRNLDEVVGLRAVRNRRDVRKAVTEMLVSREIRRIAGYSVAMADATANRVLFVDGGPAGDPARGSSRSRAFPSEGA